MIGNRVGVLATLVAALSLSPSSGAREAQAPPSTSQQATQNAIHSVKITLADITLAGKKSCRVMSVSPETVGVYPGDSLVWNVENACDTDATVRLEMEPVEGAKRIELKPDSKLFVKGEAWRGEVSSVPSQGRARLVTPVDGEEAKSGKSRCSKVCIPDTQICIPKVCTCARPPCPPI